MGMKWTVQPDGSMTGYSVDEPEPEVKAGKRKEPQGPEQEPEEPEPEPEPEQEPEEPEPEPGPELEPEKPKRETCRIAITIPVSVREAGTQRARAKGFECFADALRAYAHKLGRPNLLKPQKQSTKGANRHE